MTARHQATGVNCTPKWVWIYFTDTRSVVPRRQAVRVPWGHIADVFRELSDGVNAEYARRMQAEADAQQLPLPLERWE